MENSFGYRRALLRSVRHRRFDIWIDADVSRNKVGLLLSSAAAAENRYTLGAERIDRCRAPTLLAAHFDAIAPTPRLQEHERTRMWRLARHVADHEGYQSLQFPLSVMQINYPSPTTNRYLAIFCGASVPMRVWPLERYAQIARGVHARHDLTPIFLGDATSQDLATIMGNTPYVDLRGRTNAHDLVACIANAALTLTNDSAALHLAALLERPTVVVSAGAAYSRYCHYPEPYVIAVHREDNRCFDCEGHCRYGLSAQGLYPCLDDVGADEVAFAVDAIIESHCKKNGA